MLRDMNYSAAYLVQKYCVLNAVHKFSVQRCCGFIKLSLIKLFKKKKIL